MAKLTVLPDGRSFDVPDNSRFLDVIDTLDTGLVYGCRAGGCGTCMIRVVAHPEGLSPMRAAEQRVLAALRAPSDHRLACVSRLQGDVTVEPARRQGQG
jgi:ferredoxin